MQNNAKIIPEMLRNRGKKTHSLERYFHFLQEILDTYRGSISKNLINLMQLKILKWDFIKYLKETDLSEKKRFIWKTLNNYY